MNRVSNFTAIAVSSVVFLVCGEINAETATAGGYTWTYRITGGKAEITTAQAIRPAISPTPTGVVTIPSTLGGKPVTSIGYYALYNCSGLTGVTIPDSVTSIGDSAFFDCSGLTSVTIPDSVTSIGRAAFSGCSGLTNISIGDGVTYIGTNAFSSCSRLTSVTIPGSVRIIDKSAFSSCSALANVTISEGVTSIGETAFSYCTALTSVTIPTSVTKIGLDAFKECQSLWAKWYRSFLEGRAYDLTQTAGDRAVASVTVGADSAIDSFVLKDGKVYDSVLYINNTADHAVTLTLPSGYVYKAIKGATPLMIPANAQCILSITRVAEQVFIVSREDLETIQ